MDGLSYTCVDGSTLITTEFGLQRIRTIWPSEVPLEQGFHAFEKPLLVATHAGPAEATRIHYCGTKPVCEITFSNDMKILATPDHRFKVPADAFGGVACKYVRDLIEGDLVFWVGLYDLSLEVDNHLADHTTVVSIVECMGEVYDLHVPDVHTYIANGVVSYNSLDLGVC